MLKVRSSELSNMMTNPKSKSEKLSETTKTWLKKKAKEEFYGYHESIESKYLDKGIQCEQDAIDLINLAGFTQYKKNEVRINSEWLTGECDIETPKEIIDVKTNWDLTTFPAFQEDMDKYVKAGGYDWQIYAYCMLYKKESGRIVACMVDTPDHLLKDWDNMELHIVSHIEPSKRITWSSEIVLTVDIVKAINERYIDANEYYIERVSELNNK